MKHSKPSFAIAVNVRKATRKDIYHLKDFSVLERLNRQLLDAAKKA